VRRSLVILLAAFAFPGSAVAAPVLVLGHHGRARWRSDPYLIGPAVTPAPATRLAAGPVAARAADRAARPRLDETPAVVRRGRRASPPITVASTLTALYRARQIPLSTLRQDIAAYNGALVIERRLRGTRRDELAAVTATIHAIAAAHALSASLLPEVFATLSANVQWWTSGPLLSPDQRVEFAGSQLVWEYYPGQGIQLQVLGSFGKADGLFTGGPADYPAMQQLLTEMLALAAQRGGGLAWDYLFNFDGGSPPWVSAMAQGTGLEALGRAYAATGQSSYAQAGASALALFHRPAPVGVAEPAPNGTRFLQYSFAPHTDIINAFLQTLIGLRSFAAATGNAEAAALFSAGEAQARAEVPSFDTGAWSLYQPGIEDDLSYHELVTGFLEQMCELVGQPVYCTTAQHFQADLHTAPVIRSLTTRGRAGQATVVRFALSKVSRVGVTVTRNGHVVLATSAQFPHGIDAVTLPTQRQAGTYLISLYAVDLAGNAARTAGTLQLAPPPRRRRSRPGAGGGAPVRG
jgi:hypothetical protein